MPSKRKLKNQIEDLEEIESSKEDLDIIVGKAPPDKDIEPIEVPFKFPKDSHEGES